LTTIINDNSTIAAPVNARIHQTVVASEQRGAQIQKVVIASVITG
jgi:hypothetical protein